MFANASIPNMDFTSFATASSDVDGALTTIGEDESVFPRPAPRAPRITMDNVASTKDMSNNNQDQAIQEVTVESEMMQMMAAVNDQLEHELVETKTTVKRLLKELVSLQTVSTEVHSQWTPLLEAEHQEAVRLNELQSEVHGSVAGMALPQNL